MSKVYALAFIIIFYLLVYEVTPIVGTTLLVEHGSLQSASGISYLEILLSSFSQVADPSIVVMGQVLIFFNFMVGIIILLILRGD